MSELAPQVTYPPDPLSALNTGCDLGEQLESIHQCVRRTCPFVDRVAVAMYDNQVRMLRTFLSSNVGETPLHHYEALLEDAPSLSRTIELRKPRVVNDLVVFADGVHEHTRRIHKSGFRSSFTFPLVLRQEAIGCVFFNSYRKHCFTPSAVETLSLFSHLIARVVGTELIAVRTMIAAMRTANDMVHYKDPETGNHLERMSRYSRLIAQQLSRQGTHELDDEFIEHLFLFSPLHDVGKIGIPDEVLLKPDRLDADEWEVMKTHAHMGRVMLDTIIANFGLETLRHVDVLRHIAEHHHETMDGRGYPQGLEGKTIAVEARVVAVADVFDALTSQRPYKSAWSNDEAYDQLRLLARDKLDRDCVEALLEQRSAVEAIQKQFRDRPDSSQPNTEG